MILDMRIAMATAMAMILYKNVYSGGSQSLFNLEWSCGTGGPVDR